MVRTTFAHGKRAIGYVIIQIVILAMVAAFLGLRLYSVLGRRAEHEEEAVPTRFDQPDAGVRPGTPKAIPPTTPSFRPREFSGMPPAIEQGLRSISAADRHFDLGLFVDGAKSAYSMVLEAFWAGDRDTLRELCDSDVYDGFAAAIAEREAAGETLDNRLVRIEEAIVHSADFDGRVARITMRFTADIAAVTRDKDGNVVAGSLDDAIESHDIWTFSRDVNSSGPAWLLDETDEG